MAQSLPSHTGPLAELSNPSLTVPPASWQYIFFSHRFESRLARASPTSAARYRIFRIPILLDGFVFLLVLPSLPPRRPPFIAITIGIGDRSTRRSCFYLPLIRFRDARRQMEWAFDWRRVFEGNTIVPLLSNVCCDTFLLTADLCLTVTSFASAKHFESGSLQFAYIHNNYMVFYK